MTQPANQLTMSIGARESRHVDNKIDQIRQYKNAKNAKKVRISARKF